VAFAIHVILNIITNGLYTSEHYIVVAADTGGALKTTYEENICYTYSLYKIIKPKAYSVALSLLP
jgi:hypothetical protein